MENYFEIEHLECSYNHKDSVLKIEELNIPRGKVVFVVGESGCGKSTFLETIGLMNNTIHNPSGKAKFIFRPNENTEPIDCLHIWSGKAKRLSDIREKYFSFIFQQTNLMKNFSIRENALIPLLVKRGSAQKTGNISEKYAAALKNVNLDQILDENKNKVSELSGGQQQRLAFVRAFLPDFQILFGDEPTGNLDPVNAEKLTGKIREVIHESQDKTAIIVSHTPELYNKYADLIIRIHPGKHENGKTYGIIDKDSIEIPSQNH